MQAGGARSGYILQEVFGIDYNMSPPLSLGMLEYAPGANNARTSVSPFLPSGLYARVHDMIARLPLRCTAFEGYSDTPCSDLVRAVYDFPVYSDLKHVSNAMPCIFSLPLGRCFGENRVDIFLSLGIFASAFATVRCLHYPLTYPPTPGIYFIFLNPLGRVRVDDVAWREFWEDTIHYHLQFMLEYLRVMWPTALDTSVTGPPLPTSVQVRARLRQCTLYRALPPRYNMVAMDDSKNAWAKCAPGDLIDAYAQLFNRRDIKKGPRREDQARYDHRSPIHYYDPSAAEYDPSVAEYDPSAAEYDPSAAEYDSSFRPTSPSYRPTSPSYRPASPSNHYYPNYSDPYHTYHV